MRKRGILVVSIIGIILLMTVSGSVSAAGSESIAPPVCSKQHNVTITLYGVNIPGAGSTGNAVMPVWISGQSGSFQLEAKNGIPPYHWTVKPGSQLPGQSKSQGFSLSERGILSGTAPVLPSGQQRKLSPSFIVMVWDSDTPPACDEETLTITFEQTGVSTPAATTIPPTAPILTVATILPTTSEPTSAKTEPTTAIPITTTRAPSTTITILSTVSPTSPTPSTATTVVQNQPAPIPDFIGWIIKIILPSATPVPAIPTIEPTPSEPTIVTTEPTTPTSAITTIRPTLPTTTLTTIPPTVLTPTKATIKPTITSSATIVTTGQIQPENKPDFIGGLLQFFTGLLPSGENRSNCPPDRKGNLMLGGLPTKAGPNAPLMGQNTPAWPVWKSGQDYSADLYAYGGKPPYTWYLKSGSQLPYWLSFKSPEGELAGTAEVLDESTSERNIPVGTFIVWDSSNPQQCEETATYVKIIQQIPSLTLVPLEIPDLIEGEQYVDQKIVEVTGGTPPYHYSSGFHEIGYEFPPPGMLLSSLGGTLGGTPLKQGVYSGTITITDSNGKESATPVIVTVLPPKKIAVKEIGTENADPLEGKWSGTYTYKEFEDKETFYSHGNIKIDFKNTQTEREKTEGRYYYGQVVYIDGIDAWYSGRQSDDTYTYQHITLPPFTPNSKETEGDHWVMKAEFDVDPSGKLTDFQSWIFVPFQCPYGSLNDPCQAGLMLSPWDKSTLTLKDKTIEIKEGTVGDSALAPPYDRGSLKITHE